MFRLLTNDEIASVEDELHACEAAITRLRMRQAVLVQRLEHEHVDRIDGARNLQEWVAAKLDVEPATARKLIETRRALAWHRDLGAAAAAGDVTLDRALATVRLADAGASAEVVRRSRDVDLAGVRRLTARHRRLSRKEEQQVYRERFVAMQPTLDQTAWRLWGQLPGLEGRIVERALQQRGDELRELPGPGSPRAARRADALISMAQDTLDPPSPAGDVTGSRDPLVAVFVDAAAAGGSRGEAGAEVEWGPKAGPAALERILCAGRVQLIGLENAGPVAASDATRTIPPTVRRFVAWRDGGCTIEGCRSRYRLEPHHVIGWADGGGHDAANLSTLCWYHHHVKIHGEGHRLDPFSPPGRRRLLPPGPDPPHH
ncbi:MAG TPA: HNH endonuclease signature motif containing protein [Acidimicrobiia bacterium]|jgi:hypothetical protein|nr:HNH endonuclease signature motif containing protein [Acidimicrobiia bacterium]